MSSTSLEKQAVRGTLWTVFGYGSSQGLRFAGNLILTRLLVPDLFGLMALVQIFIRGLSLFSDIGIRPSIIRSDRGDDPIFLNTAWTIQVIRGFGLWIGCLMIALPVSNYYENPKLIWLIPIVGLTTIISGFNSTSLASLNRHLEVSKLSLLELGVQIVSLVILIVWATLSPSIWALVGGNLISVALMALCSHRLNSGKPNRFVWDPEAIKEIISFGKWIFLSTAMTFLASEADRILLGKFFSLELLGIYVVAFTFADIPRQVSLKVSTQILLPTFSQLLNQPRKTVKAKIIKKRWNMLLLLGFIVTVLFCFGDLIILNLYDSRYQQAAWMLPIIAIGLWPLLLCTTIDRFLMAIGKPIYSATGNCCKFIYMIVVIPIAYSKIGVLGAIIAIAFNDIPYYLAINYGLWREKFLGITQDVRATILLVGTIALVTIVRFKMGWGFSLDGIL